MKSIIKHFTLFLLLLSLSITQISVVNATGLSSQTASTPKEGTDDPPCDHRKGCGPDRK